MDHAKNFRNAAEISITFSNTSADSAKISVNFSEYLMMLPPRTSTDSAEISNGSHLAFEDSLIFHLRQK